MRVAPVETEKELQDAFSVRFKVFVEEQKVPAEEELDQYDETATHVVVYDLDTPIGTGRVREADGYAKLERICILEDYRGKGSGRIIMDELERVSDPHLKKFKLNAQVQAVPFYERLGYKVVSEEFMDAGIPHVTMVKDRE
ncbi:GNAT family N-acetyltransferase [Metabacillus sp. GX 13764]|uniref:GNAT family N-acetyltransferase n=1 Tax=Metabacillus kandeliae TaxID=2900151 RepID=UPI001E5B4CD9|nr:GNAT family N-acetyltransferase [Metabacillus kandeliae]MCD7035012.1 GNAT family N-acetyltransferase [Metabacillus kandeliae]